MDVTPDTIVDARGKSCPMPVVMARKAINEIESGRLMLLEATDVGSKSDIPAWCRDLGHELVETSEDAGVFRYLIRKK